MEAVLLLGFLIGLRHALEADHLAAVASLATRAHSVRQSVRMGALWGLGHTLTLFLFGWLVLVMDVALPETYARWLEFAVGAMLVVLGADVLRRFVRERIHYHLHRHADGKSHFHAHSHRGEVDHDPGHHDHAHTRALQRRALYIGLMHGMAGSAALILLTLQQFTSPVTGLIYVGLFGLGSILGMVLLSLVIAVPMRRVSTGLTFAHNVLQCVIGLGTVGLGISAMMANWSV